LQLPVVATSLIHTWATHGNFVENDSYAPLPLRYSMNFTTVTKSTRMSNSNSKATSLDEEGNDSDDTHGEEMIEHDNEEDEIHDDNEEDEDEDYSPSTTSANAAERVWDLYSNMKTSQPLDANHTTLVMAALVHSHHEPWMAQAEELFQELLASSSTLTRDVYKVYFSGWLTYNGLTQEQWDQCKVVLEDALERSKAHPQEPLVDASMFAQFMECAYHAEQDEWVLEIYNQLCTWHKRLPVASMAPNAQCLNVLLYSYTRMLRPVEAEGILMRLVEEARSHPEAGLAAHPFESVINCYLERAVQSEDDNDSLTRAEQLLLRALELDQEFEWDLSEESLYAIVAAWATSGRADAPSRAAALVEAYASQSSNPVSKECKEMVKHMQSPSFTTTT
jgi:hypothetical protein